MPGGFFQEKGGAHPSAKGKKADLYGTLALLGVSREGKSPASSLQQGGHFLTKVHAGL